MKRLVKTLSLAIVVLLISAVASAQSVEDISLTVSSDGVTKDEAVKNALRSAIEQAFGTFVSANTTILNDELVKDEVVTLSNGNIKNYKEVSSVQLPNGNTFVTLSATVSLSKLTSYAKSKGSTCEFAGATFGANLKLMELNIENTKKVLDNLIIQLKELAPYMYDYELKLGEPTAKGNIKATVYCKNNAITQSVYDILVNTFNSITNSHERFDYKKLQVDTNSWSIYNDIVNAERPFFYLRTPKSIDKEMYVEKIRGILADGLDNFRLSTNLGELYTLNCLVGDDQKKYEIFYIGGYNVEYGYKYVDVDYGETRSRDCGDVSDKYFFAYKSYYSDRQIHIGKRRRDSIWGRGEELKQRSFVSRDGTFYFSRLLNGDISIPIMIHIPITEISKVTNISVENKSLTK